MCVTAWDVTAAGDCWPHKLSSGTATALRLRTGDAPGWPAVDI